MTEHESEQDEPEAQDHEQDPAAEPQESEKELEEGLQEGDFVKLSYSAWTAEDGQLVDTTEEEVAEEEDVDEEGRSFQPRTVAIGEDHIFETVEQDLIGREVGDEGTTTVPAEEAFGEYDPDEVRTISVEKIPEDDRYPGAHVDIEGEHGHVETVIGGRARVDFNHPLAGSDIEYDYEIVEEVEDRVERARGILGMYVDTDLEMWIQTDEEEEEVPAPPDPDEEEADDDEGAEADDEEKDAAEEIDEIPMETQTIEKETLYIEATPQLTMNQQWMIQKQQIASQIMNLLGLDRVIVQETIDGGGMGGMLGGMGGMGMGGGGVEEALEDADVDAEELAEELEGQ